jgi:hypothetical protein
MQAPGPSTPLPNARAICSQLLAVHASASQSVAVTSIEALPAEVLEAASTAAMEHLQTSHGSVLKVQLACLVLILAPGLEERHVAALCDLLATLSKVFSLDLQVFLLVCAAAVARLQTCQDRVLRVRLILALGLDKRHVAALSASWPC